MAEKHREARARRGRLRGKEPGMQTRAIGRGEPDFLRGAAHIVGGVFRVARWMIDLAMLEAVKHEDNGQQAQQGHEPAAGFLNAGEERVQGGQ